MEVDTTVSSAPDPAMAGDPSPDVTDPAAVAAPQRTIEDVDAYWRERQGKQDRAHAAAEGVLKERVASLERQLGATPTSLSGQPPDPSTDTISELRRLVAEKDAALSVEQRRSKFPAISAALGRDADPFLANGDEVGLAKLNSQLEEQNGTLIAPTAPKRAAPSAPKPYSQKSKEELLDDLRRVAPAYEAWVREQEQT